MFFVRDKDLEDEIERVLSAPRLSTYVAAIKGDQPRAIDLYCWNTAVGAAFFGPLGVLEVALRNALDSVMTSAFAEPWYDDPNFRAIDPKMTAKVGEAGQAIQKRGKLATHPRMVAELSFGFWVQMLRPGPGGVYVRTLWGPALSKAFPKGTTRKQVLAVFDRLRDFRNRVAHHEPIFASDLNAQYRALLEALHLLSPTLVPWIEHHSRVRELVSRGPWPSPIQY